MDLRSTISSLSNNSSSRFRLHASLESCGKCENSIPSFGCRDLYKSISASVYGPDKSTPLILSCRRYIFSQVLSSVFSKATLAITVAPVACQIFIRRDEALAQNLLAKLKISFSVLVSTFQIILELFLAQILVNVPCLSTIQYPVSYTHLTLPTTAIV